ncbi:hypothetical protein RB595_004922 [Gaeumannomyces hyphopodioides]
MKYTILATALAMAHQASAHYFFNKLIVNDVATRDDEYVLQNSRQAKYNPTKWAGLRDNATPDGPEMRCNLGAFQSQSRTKIADVKAGDKLGFKLAVGAKMGHPGPSSVYMSKAPTTVDKYQGDADWFKVYEDGVCDKTKDFTRDAWCSYDKDTIEFRLPQDVPNGDYLVRVEHIGLHQAHFGQAEFYMSCAQVRITGGGNGKPGPMIKFPGGYKKDDASFNFSIYNGFKPYPMPGPAVWTGGNSGAAAANETEPVQQATTSLPATTKPTSSVAPVAGKPTTTSAPVAGRPTTTFAPVVGRPTSAPAAGSSSVAAAPVASGKPTCNKKARRHAKEVRMIEQSE